MKNQRIIAEAASKINVSLVEDEFKMEVKCS